MEVIAFPRSEQGSGASRRLRRAGQTPGIIYGGTEAPLNIALDHNALLAQAQAIEKRWPLPATEWLKALTPSQAAAT